MKIDEDGQLILSLSPQKAAIINDTAIISDLHLGIESMMEGRSVTFPRVQIQEIIENLRLIINTYNVKNVVIAGDLKQEFSRNLPYEWEDVELFLDSFSDIRFEVLRGNHDNYLPNILSKYEMSLKENIQVGKYTILHGHNHFIEGKEKITYKSQLNIIMGHEHPAIKIRKSGAVYRYPCFLFSREKNVLILPAFSPLSQGIDILTTNSFLSPLLRNAELRPDDFEVYAVERDVIYLGKIEHIKRAGIR